MRNRILTASIIAIAALSAVTYVIAADYGAANDTSTMSSTETMSSTMATCPAPSATMADTGMMGAPSGTMASPANRACPGAWQPGMSSEQMMKRRQQMMSQAGVPQEMQMRDKMFMCATLDPNDPQALMAVSDDLNLTADQQKKLSDIQQKARSDAQAVLTSSQQAQVSQLAATPRTMLDMCHKMGAMMPRGGAMMGAPSATMSTTAGQVSSAPSGSYPMMGCQPMSSGQEMSGSTPSSTGYTY